MKVTVFKNGERLTSYNCKRSFHSLKAIRAIRKFYKGLYPESKIEIKNGV